VSEAEWAEKQRVWVTAPGAYANWISPPTLAINKQPADFEFVRFN
jgi:benzoyl-CoA 2,3-dioxygenase component B